MKKSRIWKTFRSHEKISKFRTNSTAILFGVKNDA